MKAISAVVSDKIEKVHRDTKKEEEENNARQQQWEERMQAQHQRAQLSLIQELNSGQMQMMSAFSNMMAVMWRGPPPPQRPAAGHWGEDHFSSHSGLLQEIQPYPPNFFNRNDQHIPHTATRPDNEQEQYPPATATNMEPAANPSLVPLEQYARPEQYPPQTSMQSPQPSWSPSPKDP